MTSLSYLRSNDLLLYGSSSGRVALWRIGITSDVTDIGLQNNPSNESGEESATVIARYATPDGSAVSCVLLQHIANPAVAYSGTGGVEGNKERCDGIGSSDSVTEGVVAIVGTAGGRIYYAIIKAGGQSGGT